MLLEPKELHDAAETTGRRNTIKAAILARCSSSDPKDDRIDSQVAACRAYAEANGYTVNPAHVFAEENVSRRLDPALRGALQQAWTLLETRAVDAIIVRDYTRLGGRLDTAQLLENARAYGKGIILVQTPAPEDKMGRLITMGAWGMISALEPLIVFGRTARGRRESMQRGGLGCGGIPPYMSYTKTGGFRLDEEKAAPIRRMLDDYEAGKSVTEIAAEAGIPRVAFYAILNQPIIAGRRYIWPLDDNPNPDLGRAWKNQRTHERYQILRGMYGKTVDEADALARENGLLVQEVPELIPWHRWQRLLRQKARNRVVHPARTTLGLPLQSRMRCTVCGSAYIAAVSTDRQRTYVECVRRKKSHSIDLKRARCDAPRFRYEPLEAAVAKQIAEWISSPDAVRQAAESYLEGLDADTARLETALGPTANQIEKLRARRGRYHQSWLEGESTEAEWHKERDRLDREIRRLEEQAEGTEETRQELAFVKGRADEIRQLLKGNFATSSDARLLTRLHEFIGKTVAAGQREALRKALERFDVRLLLGPDGIRMTAAILPDAIDLGGSTSLLSSGRPRRRFVCAARPSR